MIADLPQSALETGALYRYIGDMNRVNCPKMSETDFDSFIGPLDVNVVSYVLLETRLSQSNGATGRQAVQAYLQQYRDAWAKLDDNAILPLIDIAYYKCKGGQACIGNHIQSLVDIGSLTKRASCLYGMPVKCEPADLRPNFYFLNDETLAALPNSQNALQQRAQFLCDRYRDCEHGSTGEKQRWK